jgi:hypothetical protein
MAPGENVISSSSRPGRESIVAPFAVFSCILGAALVFSVLGLMPHKSQAEWQDRLHHLQGTRNFLNAEKLIKPMLPSPAMAWSGPIQTHELGNGIWYAEGTVTLDDPKKSTPEKAPAQTLPWKAIFFPSTVQPLYLSLGSATEGDHAGALRQAGVTGDAP